MSTLFRRQSAVSCFFCQSRIVPLPQKLNLFRCPHCQCWNRYDDRGEIISDEPAMHDEALNRKSFAKRASPSKDRLPTVYNKSPFCHTCQTNQMLLVSLLSNYLPAPDHPEYTRRLEALPEYKTSLDLRYPPVCASCRPLVEEEISNKDHMARTRALGEWLKESKGKGKQRQASGIKTNTGRIGREIHVWRVRGCLWVAMLMLAVVGNTAGALGFRPSQHLTVIPPSSFLLLTILSVIWTAWDPTYSRLRKAQLQGRDVRQRGKKEYIILQLTAWCSRLLTSILICVSCFCPHLDYLRLSSHPSSRQSRAYFSISLVVELVILIASLTVLRLQRPSQIRLIDTHSHKPSSARQTPDPALSALSAPNSFQVPSPISEPDLLSTLSLSSKPILSSPDPVFGVPSLTPSSTSGPVNTISSPNPEPDPDEMDWTPTHNPFLAFNQDKQNTIMKNPDDGSWLRPQTFFAPEQPTGLEGLFARTRLADGASDSASRSRTRGNMRWWRGWWLYPIAVVSIAIIPIAIVGYHRNWTGLDSRRLWSYM